MVLRPGTVMAGKGCYGWTYEGAEELGEGGDVVYYGYDVEYN